MTDRWSVCYIGGFHGRKHVHRAPLRALNVPTLLVWGTGDQAFGVKWAYYLRDMIPGAREVIEVDGAKVFFPEERPDDLVPHLRRQWGR